MREKWPQIYLTAVITLFPKQTQKLESPFADLSDEEIAQFEQWLAAGRARLVPEIEPIQKSPTSSQREKP